jgi:hypothetical protein
MTTTYVLDEEGPRDQNGRPTRVRAITDFNAPQVKHVRGPGGVHDVPDSHPAVMAIVAEELGIGTAGGWRWATADEVRAMYRNQGVEVPEEFREKHEEKPPRTTPPPRSTSRE